MKFGDIMRHLRQINEMTQKELADKLSISPSTIGMYEQNRRVPDIDTVSKIATIFNVSLDYLLGMESSLNEKLELNASHSVIFFVDNFLKSTFTSRLKKTMDNKGLSEDVFAELLHIKKEKLQSYANGDYEPSLEDLIAISKSLEVSIDYLLGKASVQGDKLLYSFQSLTEDNQDIIIGKVKELLKEQRYDEFAVTDEPLRKTGTDSLAK